MNEFMNWLRVELLRSRSLDWGTGSWEIRWVKDGVAKFISYYSTSGLAAKFGVSEDDILGFIDSPPVISELEGKSFTLSWKDGCIALAWLEEGVGDWKTHTTVHYHEDNGKYYSKCRMTTTVVYLDGTERVVHDTGDPRRVCITKEEFNKAVRHIRRNSDKQT